MTSEPTGMDLVVLIVEVSPISSLKHTAFPLPSPQFNAVWHYCLCSNMAAQGHRLTEGIKTPLLWSSMEGRVVAGLSNFPATSTSPLLANPKVPTGLFPPNPCCSGATPCISLLKFVISFSASVPKYVLIRFYGI